MNKIDLPHSGWGNGTVPVEHAPGDDGTVLEIQGNRLGGYNVYGLVDTPEHLEQGDRLCAVHFTGGRVRSIVPRRYTHVKIEKNSRSAGIVWWKVGFRSADTCPELGDTIRGSCPDVVQYRGPAAKALLEVGKGYANLYRSGMSGKGRRELKRVSDGPFRGAVELPQGPVLLSIDCLVSWSLTVPSMTRKVNRA
ncbi:hypothetical protein amrb99_89090 [Actinomadura sp. RB99]|uniref:hypothetical protein n=1 Tax=Actinomadura sp. RB99 TaxID=2691577 RepID=UPI0016897F88|nr:hypothetical protein [Actinomadura sp. RB99]MBD2899912.1 hypothetical protein [Actinomadura sp. RB99]